MNFCDNFFIYFCGILSCHILGLTFSTVTFRYNNQCCALRQNYVKKAYVVGSKSTSIFPQVNLSVAGKTIAWNQTGEVIESIFKEILLKPLSQAIERTYPLSLFSLLEWEALPLFCLSTFDESQNYTKVRALRIEQINTVDSCSVFTPVFVYGSVELKLFYFLYSKCLWWVQIGERYQTTENIASERSLEFHRKNKEGCTRRSSFSRLISNYLPVVGFKK